MSPASSLIPQPCRVCPADVENRWQVSGVLARSDFGKPRWIETGLHTRDRSGIRETDGEQETGDGGGLRSKVVVLLISERPGLATAESLSAYLAFRPMVGHTDADRNLIWNIHSCGVTIQQAAERILALAETLRAAGRSGVGTTEHARAPTPMG